MIVRIVARVAW